MASTPASQVLDETDPAKPLELEISPEDDRLFLSLEDYCWEDDPEFQSGLTQILTTATDPSHVRQLTRQAKCFFYARKISRPISFPLYSAWLDREESSAPRCRSPSCQVGPALDPTDEIQIQISNNDNDDNSNPTMTTDSRDKKEETGDDKTPYPTSFAQIVELITSGKPIPGIKEIPNTLNTAPPTQNTAQQRRKPWEVVADVTPATATGSEEAGADSLPTPAPTPLD
ncbi:hypothetical protein TWF694_003960 [Orbilia ellipsospora]|uniref:Uncharacterized protein n=1 Tax=Orbilia ellipsospora TaxID=2528407 RepID=A0AAV9WWP2_9PEZI